MVSQKQISQDLSQSYRDWEAQIIKDLQAAIHVNIYGKPGEEQEIEDLRKEEV